MKNKKNKLPTIELLNSEGPLLKLTKSRGSFIVFDEWSNIVDVLLTSADVIDFIEGRREIIDSDDRTWHYPSVSQGMKMATIEEINKFISPQLTVNSEGLYLKYMEWVDYMCEECDWKTDVSPHEIVYAIAKLLEENPKLITFHHE